MMALTNVADVLTPEERAREPRSLGIVAYFDGYMQATYGARPDPMPRRLTRDEETCWRDGWREGYTSRVCHSWHGSGRHWWREMVTDAWFSADQAWQQQLEAVAVGYDTEGREFAQQHPRPTLGGFMRALSAGEMSPEDIYRGAA